MVDIKEVDQPADERQEFIRQKARRRRARQRERRRQRYTLFEEGQSPVIHLLTYAHECCGNHPDFEKMHRDFGDSMGETVQSWFQSPAAQKNEDWVAMQDAFLLRFLSHQKEGTRNELMKWIQHGGEKTARYINKWRSLSWSDAEAELKEEDILKGCLETAAYGGKASPVTFLTALDPHLTKPDKARMRQILMPSKQAVEQFDVETHIERVLKELTRQKSAALSCFPELRKLKNGMRAPSFKTTAYP